MTKAPQYLLRQRIRYAIDNFKLKNDLNWSLKNDFEVNLRNTIKWYFDHSQWCKEISEKSNFFGQRLGTITN